MILSKEEKDLIMQHRAGLDKKSVNLNYSNWEADFGFLVLCMTRKTTSVKDYFIKQFSEMTTKTGFIKNKDIEGVYLHSVQDVVDMISDNYKNFLIEKYFKNETEYVRFISESIFNEIVAAAIDANREKINKNYIEEFKKSVMNLNAQQNQK